MNFLRKELPVLGHVSKATFYPVGIGAPSSSLIYPSNIQAFSSIKDASLLLRIVISLAKLTVFVSGAAMHL